MNVSKDIRFRVYISFLAMCLFGLMILYKGVVIQFKEGRELRAQADSLHTKVDTLQPERGNIYSEDGSLLSSSIPEFDLRIDFKAIKPDTFNKYIEPLAHDLARILKDDKKEIQKTWMDYKELLSHEYKEQSRYFLLKNKASYAQYLQIRELQPFVKGQNKGGLISEPSTKRIYPFGLLANRVIGVWRKEAQCIGIEREYDKQLSGTKGQRIVRRIAGGTWMPIDGSEIDPENGMDVITTLDVNIQDVAETALYQQLKKEDAAFGTCIVMEVKTGKIKAMANLGKTPQGDYYEDFNYAIKRLEPGSTFKLVSLISLLHDKKITLDQKVDCQGGHSQFGPYRISDSHSGLGILTIKDAFAHSSNVAFAKLIYQNYKDDIVNYWNNLHDLGLDQTTGLGLSGEVKPKINRDSVTKGRYSLAYMGMGYQVLITPLHTCMVYNAIANNGKLMKPYLVNSVQEYGKDVITYQPKVLNESVLDSASIVALKETMNEVVETGTGKALKNNYYKICGKTGTAQVADKGIKYSDRVYHGSFVGFFPKEDPKYTICVVLRTKKGSNNYYGGQIALPVFKEVANRLYAINMRNANTVAKREAVKNNEVFNNLGASSFNVLNTLLKLKSTPVHSNNYVQNIRVDSTGRLSYNLYQYQQGAVPNVNGMNLRDAVYLLEKSGLKVTPQGRGKVVGQSLEAGSALIKGQKITIQLG